MFGADRIFPVKSGKIDDVNLVDVQNFRVGREVAVRVEQVERLDLRVVQLTSELRNFVFLRRRRCTKIS